MALLTFNNEYNLKENKYHPVIAVLLICLYYLLAYCIYLNMYYFILTV